MKFYENIDEKKPLQPSYLHKHALSFIMGFVL